MKTEQRDHDYLSKALAPRDENGHIVPIISLSGTALDGKPLFFPYIPPSEGKGIVPMVFNEDFAPGGQYYDLTYQPGFYAEPFGVMENGIEVPLFPSEVIFADPRLNMPQLAYTVMQQGLPREMLPTANYVMAALEHYGAKPDFSSGLLDRDEARFTLHLKNRTGRLVPVCNSGLEVIALRRLLNGQKESFEIRLKLLRKDIEVDIPEANLENLSDFLGAKHPWFHLSADTPNAAALLAEYIRDGLEEVPTITVAKQPGWIVHEGKHIYANDGLRMMHNLSCETGKTIPFDPAMAPADAYAEALGILDIGSHAVTVPLFLTSIAGPLAALFQDAGYPPRFCTFLYGLSGSLKTATAEVFAGFFGERDLSTFRDTPAAIDVNIGKHRDRTLLVDDFCPPLASAEGKTMCRILEHVIRLFGDDVAKMRSNSTATATRGERPRGTCIITGESISGSYSSLLRCLLVPVTRGDIDGALLRRYQEVPELWCSNYVHFLHWVGENWENLEEKVRARFPALRASFARVSAEPRLVDAGVLLILTGEILLDFGVACGAVGGAGREEYLSEWRATILDTLRFSASLTGEVDLVSLCRDALDDALDAGTLQVAATVEEFQKGMDGFLSADRLWLRKESLIRVMRRKSKEMSASCMLSAKAVLPELYNHGLILRDEEEGKNSFLKRTPYIPALEKRTRMLCFDQNELNAHS